jgi:YesN/AraC family two-component response regulator
MLNKAEIKNVDSALNGLEGFNQVKIKNYDLIICDINMPVMDGFECAQQIKNLYSSKNKLFE